MIAIAGLGCALISNTCPAVDAEPDKAQSEYFEREIRPLLVERCVKCHGAEKPKGGLQLLSRETLARGGTTGPVVAPGKPGESRLIKAVNYQEIEMPPDGRLKQDEIARLTRWVEQGAYWPAGDGKPVSDAKPAEPVPAPAFAITPAQRAFWAIQSPKHAVPETQDAAWPRTDLDRFILNKLEVRGLKPAPPADKRTLIRRATFDLTGLPPTPQEVDAFLADSSPRAFVRVVERLLASPHYGERWGRHWLDVARYADSYEAAGSEVTRESERSEAYRYRDWVVKAMNRDLPYDRFIIEQIAGDLAPPLGPVGYDPNPIIATGFLTFGGWRDPRRDKEELLADIVDDQIDLVSRSFLGLSISCARCHDHRSDPISTEDYYALAGIFYSTNVLASVGEKGSAPMPLRIALASPDELKRRDERKRRVEELTAQSVQAPTDALRAEAAAALDKLKASEPPPLEYAYGAQDGGAPQTPHAGLHDVAIHVDGRCDRLGKVVPRRFPIILAGDKQQPIAAGSGRLQLAQWIASADNPLTARVMVNRIWRHHFGRGIVSTVDDFGQSGLRPTHPELLDWLAIEFVRSGWSIKGMHRAMMLSATYQQSSVPAEATRIADPENLLLGRMPRRLLDDAEIRDAGASSQ
ncbi:MAG TPA: PSD1 and planctomycete cytochrome C domain-containing protein [Pirellulales bacterium]|jgi:cytochrome c553